VRALALEWVPFNALVNSGFSGHISIEISDLFAKEIKNFHVIGGCPHYRVKNVNKLKYFLGFDLMDRILLIHINFS
jgi:hypothetical protein